MSKKNKTWKEKFLTRMEPAVKVLEKKFSDMRDGDKMLISTPMEIEVYLRHIPNGKEVDVKTLRRDLAITHHCDNTCPLTTGIFLRIVAEKNYEEYVNGGKLSAMDPFWRVIKLSSPVAKKLTFDKSFFEERRKAEGLKD